MRYTEEELRLVMEQLGEEGAILKKRRTSMFHEAVFLDAVRRGCPEEISVHSVEEMAEELAMDSRNFSLSKQYEYLCVVCISMAVYAAIEGGADPDEVYSIGEAMLSRLARYEEPDAMRDTLELAGQACAGLVRWQSGKQSDTMVRKACRYVKDHLMEKIYLTDLAEELEVSASYLSRVFSESMGIPLQEYIQREKMEAAAGQLATTDETISGIARRFGFQSPSAFSTVFKKWKTISPSAYRERYRGRS